MENTNYKTYFQSEFKKLSETGLEHRLQDYRTNYSYDNPKQLDKECNFDSVLQTHIQKFINTYFNNKNYYKNMQFLTDVLQTSLDIFKNTHNLDENDIKLIFYNDIVLKELAERFLFTLPNKTMINLNSFFEESFEHGIFEWTILLHPQLQNYDEIYDKLQFYLAKVSKIVNKYVITKRQDIFEYFKYNNKYKSYILFELASELDSLLLKTDAFTQMKAAGNEIKSIYIGPGTHTYSFYNNSVDANEDDIECIMLENKRVSHPIQIKIKETDTSTSYYQTLNVITTIQNLQYMNKYDNNNDSNSRSSSNQTIVAIPCKLFDFTLYHRDNNFAKHFISSEDNIQEYTYINKYGDEFKFTGVSYKFICDVLEEHVYVNEPWTVSNFKVLYSRLMYFYFIDLFISVHSNRIRNSIVSLFKEYILQLIESNKEFTYNDVNNSEATYNKLVNKYGKEIGKYKTPPPKFIKLVQKIHDYNELHFKDAKYKKFLEHILVNINIFENVFNSVYSYCTKSNDIFERNLYKGDIEYIV
jgi:hypothetical protein